MSQDKGEIVIIGAGIIGLACALRLSMSGYRPVVIDAAAPGTGCSQGNAGHVATELIFPLASAGSILAAPGMLFQPHATLSIRPAYAHRIAPWLCRMIWAARPSAFRRGTQALSSLQSSALSDMRVLLGAGASLTGETDYLYARGSLLLAEQERSVPKLTTLMDASREYGVPVEPLNSKQIADYAPGLRQSYAGALYFSGTGHVSDPKRICDMLAKAIPLNGGQIIRGTVTMIAPEADGGFKLMIHANETGGREFSTDRVIVTAGIGAAALLSPLIGKIPLDTERGYGLTYPGQSPQFNLPVASFERNIIMSPLACGLRLTGGVEFGGVKAPPSEARIKALKHHARQFVPVPKTAPAEVWMGRRPSMPDYLPAIGESAKHRGLYYAFGHQHLGLTLSGVTARIIASLVEGTATSMDITPFSITRFR